MITYNIKLAKSTTRFLISNLSYLNKITVETFKEKCFIYVNTKKCIFNISISNQIVVEIDNNQDRYNTYFYNETHRYDTVEDFKTLFNTIVLQSRKKEHQELNVKYKGNFYPIFVELSDIDENRGMGTEKRYDLNIYDRKGEERFVAQVSEYPLGIFNLVHIFPEFEISENEILDYFQDKY